MICCSFLRKWSCAVRCAAFLVQEQITLASARVHMFRFFPVKSLGVFQPASVSFSLLAEVTDAQLRSAVSHVWRMSDPSANWGETPREPLPGRAAPGDKCQSSSASFHQVFTAPFSPVLLESAERRKVFRCADNQWGTPGGSLSLPFLLLVLMKPRKMLWTKAPYPCSHSTGVKVALLFLDVRWGRAEMSSLNPAFCPELLLHKLLRTFSGIYYK